MALGDRFVWVDIETTGLDKENDLILEIGFAITEVDLSLIDMTSVRVWDSPIYDKKWDSLPEDGWIKQTHVPNGLYKACTQEGQTMKAAEEYISDWLAGHGVGLEPEPLCGSSVQFDRGFFDEQMPLITEHFHYRNIDISTIKELCRRLNPELYSKLDENSTKQELHRVEPDLTDTISEARFYFENFLHLAPLAS